jgi:hypothetical protein
MSLRRFVLLALIVVGVGFIHRRRRDRREEAKRAEGDADPSSVATPAA